MKQLFDYGFGIHHAGMLRSDRNMMERMFEANCIKVLCCTATLAWGVNLPAHAVVIKGTQVYDAGRGSFVDLSILDVLQVGIASLNSRDPLVPFAEVAVCARSSVELVDPDTRQAVLDISARLKINSTITLTQCCLRYGALHGGTRSNGD
jgi:hypothetical protein